MTPPKVSIVIPVYNHLGYAREAARTALANTPDSRVFLVDDASPEWSDKPFADFPKDRLVVRRFKKNKGLTKSWCEGLLLSRKCGSKFIVVTNSDVLFPAGWWQPFEAALSARPGLLLGPTTNAPGHRPKQGVWNYLPGVELTADPPYLDKIRGRLGDAFKGQVKFTPINGFCMAATADDWFRMAFSPSHVFDPKYRMTRNEDELQGRWKKRGGKAGIVLDSFVFHFRGVSRKGGTAGREGRGWVRRGARWEGKS